MRVEDAGVRVEYARVREVGAGVRVEGARASKGRRRANTVRRRVLIAFLGRFITESRMLPKRAVSRRFDCAAVMKGYSHFACSSPFSSTVKSHPSPGPAKILKRGLFGLFFRPAPWGREVAGQVWPRRA